MTSKLGELKAESYARKFMRFSWLLVAMVVAGGVLYFMLSGATSQVSAKRCEVWSQCR